MKLLFSFYCALAFQHTVALSLRDSPANNDNSVDRNLIDPLVNGGRIIPTRSSYDGGYQYFNIDIDSSKWPQYQDVISELTEAYEKETPIVTSENDKGPFEHSIGPQADDRSEGGDDSLYEKIRFKLDFQSLEELLQDSPDSELRIDNLQSILREVIDFWSNTLYVKPLIEPLDLRSRVGGSRGSCYSSLLPEETIENTDYFLIIDGRLDDLALCSSGNVLAFAAPCVFDNTHYNPRAGKITFCMDRMSTLGGQLPANEFEQLVTVTHHELLHALGAESDYFGFFKNPATDLPYGFTRRGSGELYPCVGGSDKIFEIIPKNVRLGQYNDHLYYELTTPRVTKMAQNFFNCDRIKGLRIENQPSSGGDIGLCIGSHPVDERLFPEEISGAVSSDSTTSNIVSAFTLAILEDSGWYKVDYKKAAPLSFGLGAGCDFIEKDCIDKATGALLPSSEGYFCVDDSYDMCTVDHSAKAFCNLRFYDSIPEEYQYFPNKQTLGGYPMEQDFCPIPTASTLACDTGTKCFNRQDDHSLCLPFACNDEEYRVEFSIGSQTYFCENDLQIIHVQGTGHIRCPRIAQFCPHLVCESMCSARGKCDWSSRIPSCVCDDPNDTTSGCYSFNEQLGVSIFTVEDLSTSTPSVESTFQDEISLSPTDYPSQTSSTFVGPTYPPNLTVFPPTPASSDLNVTNPTVAQPTLSLQPTIKIGGTKGNKMTYPKEEEQDKGDKTKSKKGRKGASN